jgi:nucleolar protein 56
MKATIVGSPFGILVLSEESKLAGYVLYSKKPQAAAKALAKFEAGKVAEELNSLVSQLNEKDYDIFVFESADLAKEVERLLKVKTEYSKSTRAGELVRSEPGEFAVKTGFVNDKDEFDIWMRNVAMETTKLRVKGAVEKRDLVVAQAIQTLDELEKAVNMLMARVREWYGIYFPELDRLLEKHETYARLVVGLGSKVNFTQESLEKQDIPKAKAEAISKVAVKSMGADLEETDLTQIQSLCKDLLSLYRLRENLERYMDSTMKEVAPNIQHLLGSLLGARLISVCGGLMNLAKRPASTIQVMGAEKALFRSLKTGARPPKHGMIFQHTLLQDAKRWQ